ncbi:hypothetical protein MMC14_000438 [Varicellaria rhodocarpa]|nr:hypothetical protein [Varicellaria rhodocarpa]
MAILTFIPYELPGSRPKTVLNDDFRDINDFNKPCGEKPAKPISQRVDQSTKQRCDEPSVWKDPFRGRPELRKWLASDCVDFDERKNGNSSRAHDGNGSQGERNLSRPERTCITAIGNPLLIEDTGCDGLSRHRVEERHGLLDGSVEDTLSNETRRIDQQTLQPFNGVSKLDKNFQGVTCDENESESRYEESKADTAQIHATEDGIESDDTNVCDELGTFAIIHDRYGSIKHKTSSSSSQGQGDAVTLNIHDGYNSDSNSKGRCRSNVHDTCDVDSDEKRLGFPTKRYKFGHRRQYEDRDFKFRENDPLLGQAEGCGQENPLAVVNSTSKTGGDNSSDRSSDTDIVTDNEKLDVDESRRVIRVSSRKTSERAALLYSAETGSPFRMRSTFRTSSSPSEEGEWQITRILGKRPVNRKGNTRKGWEYQVEWATSWVPGDELGNAREMVQEFESKLRDQRRSKRGRPFKREKA